MPKISCEVVNCAYNKSHKCLKSLIDVEGPFARYKDDTSCESFIEGELPSFNYEFAEEEGMRRRDTEVSCNVASCVFMERGKCTAEAIKIKGRNAKESHETDCETFHCR